VKKSYLTQLYRKYPVSQTLFSVDSFDNGCFTEKQACFFGENG